MAAIILWARSMRFGFTIPRSPTPRSFQFIPMKAVYNRVILAALVLSGAACGDNRNAATNADSAVAITGRDSTAAPSWALLPFVKVDSVNPVLTPGKGRFTDPILHREVSWE